MDIPESLPTVHLQTLSWTVNEWLNHRDEEDRHKWILDAPYQRGSVWTVDQQRSLIRSLIMGVPIGSIVYAKIAYNWDERYPVACGRIIDGKQRVTAVRAWYADEFTVPGWWFDPTFFDNPEDRGRDLLCSDVPWAANIGHAQMPGLEFDSTTRYVPNPDHVRGGRDEATRNPWTPVRRTNAEALVAEAEIFSLINFAGVDQTDADRERAEAIAGGAS